MGEAVSSLKARQSSLFDYALVCGDINVTFTSKPDVSGPQKRWSVQSAGQLDHLHIYHVGGAETSPHTHTHEHTHRDTHIIASLWDRENAKATVNVKTCAPSRNTWIAFHSTKTLFIFLLTNLWRKRQAPRGVGRATWTLKSLSPSVSFFQSLFRSQHSLILFAPLKGQTQTKHTICNMHQWHRKKLSDWLDSIWMPQKESEEKLH